MLCSRLTYLIGNFIVAGEAEVKMLSTHTETASAAETMTAMLGNVKINWILRRL